MPASTRGRLRRAGLLTAASDADFIAEIIGWLHMDLLPQLKAVHSVWARAVRHNLCSVPYLARQPLCTLLTSWRPRRDWPCDAAVLARIATHPLEAAGTIDKDWSGELWLGQGQAQTRPIHYALSHSPRPRSDEVIRALIRAYPSMMHAPDSRGRLPLYLAAASSFVSLELTEELLTFVGPGAATALDANVALERICSTSIDKYLTLVGACSSFERKKHAAHVNSMLDSMRSEDSLWLGLPLGVGARMMLSEGLMYLSRANDGLAGLSQELMRSVRKQHKLAIDAEAMKPTGAWPCDRPPSPAGCSSDSEN